MRSSIRMAVVSVALLLVAFGSAHAQTYSQDDCAQRLIVELTPDVPNPRDPGFLSSLLSNHPEYKLTLVRQDNSTTIVVDLVGPGPDYRCRTVIETMQRDGRVEKIVSDSDDLPSVSIKTETDDDGNKPDTRLSRAGIGSLFWLAAHPEHAWKILMPVQPGMVSGAYEDLRVACLQKLDPANEVTECP